MICVASTRPCQHMADRHEHSIDSFSNVIIATTCDESIVSRLASLQRSFIFNNFFFISSIVVCLCLSRSLHVLDTQGDHHLGVSVCVWERTRFGVEENRISTLPPIAISTCSQIDVPRRRARSKNIQSPDFGRLVGLSAANTNTRACMNMKWTRAASFVDRNRLNRTLCSRAPSRRRHTTVSAFTHEKKNKINNNTTKSKRTNN